MALVSSAAIASRGLSYPIERFVPVQVVRWVAPTYDTFKINVDGSFNVKSGKAGIGGLIRISNGQWVIGFSESVEVETIFHAELLAIKKGLELVWDIGCRNVICKTDSTGSLQLIKCVNTNVHTFGDVIAEIRGLCERNWGRVQLVHILREGNQCADILTKFGSRNPCSCIWSHPLPAMLKQLEDDARGTFYYRRKL